MSKQIIVAVLVATTGVQCSAEAVFEDVYNAANPDCNAGNVLGGGPNRQYQVPIGVCMAWGPTGEALQYKTKAVCKSTMDPVFFGLTMNHYDVITNPDCKGPPDSSTDVPFNSCGPDVACNVTTNPNCALIEANTCEQISDDVYTVSLYQTIDATCGGGGAQVPGGGFPGVGAALTVSAGCVAYVRQTAACSLSNSKLHPSSSHPDSHPPSLSLYFPLSVSLRHLALALWRSRAHTTHKQRRFAATAEQGGQLGVVTAMQLSVVRGNEVMLSLYGNRVCHQESLLHTVSGIAETYSPTPRCLKMTVRTGGGGYDKSEGIRCPHHEVHGGRRVQPLGQRPGADEGRDHGDHARCSRSCWDPALDLRRRRWFLCVPQGPERTVSEEGWPHGTLDQGGARRGRWEQPGHGIVHRSVRRERERERERVGKEGRGGAWAPLRRWEW